MTILLFHFIKKRGTLKFSLIKPSLSLVEKVLKRGLPEAMTQLATPVTGLCFNIVLAEIYGDTGVSAFSVLSFLYSLVNAILSGVSQGLQPLWGQCFGMEDNKGVTKITKTGIVINLCLSAFLVALLTVFNTEAVMIFTDDKDVISTAKKALPIFALSFLPMAQNLIITSCMFSTKRTIKADAVALSRGVVLKAAAIFTCGAVLPSHLIWISPLISEGLTLLIAVWLIGQTREGCESNGKDNSVY